MVIESCVTNVIETDGKQDIYTFFLNWLETKKYLVFDVEIRKKITDNVGQFLLDKENTS